MRPSQFFLINYPLLKSQVAQLQTSNFFKDSLVKKIAGHILKSVSFEKPVHGLEKIIFFSKLRGPKIAYADPNSHLCVIWRSFPVWLFWLWHKAITKHQVSVQSRCHITFFKGYHIQWILKKMKNQSVRNIVIILIILCCTQHFNNVTATSYKIHFPFFLCYLVTTKLSV